MGRTRMKLDADEIRRRAGGLTDWRVGDGRLSKNFRFPDFQSALAFVNRVGAVAEEMGHHPDIHLGWGRADVETWTHDAGGITELDFTLAAKIDAQYTGR
jgi:4a-hydroxytetrahydrobiopterin dehydratase